MAFPVELWKIAKKTNSTMIPAKAADAVYQCVSNDTLDVLAPVIPLNIGAGTCPAQYNYAHIAAFNRYYFITNWTFQNGLWYAAMTIDVLASWKTEIGAQTLYVERSASNFDGTIPDMTYNRTADFSVTKIPFTLFNADQAAWNITGLTGSGSFVVGIVGKGGVINYWGFPYENYQSLMEIVFNYDYGFQDEALKASFNPIQYFTTIVWFPFSVALLPGTREVEMGWWTITGSKGYKLGENTMAFYGASVNLPKHPQQSRGKWLNAGDTAHYTLRLPCFGMLDIQGYDMIDATSINIEVNVDLPTGKATCLITPNSTGTATQVVDYQVGVSMPIAQLQSNIVGMGVNALRNSGGFGAMLGDVLVGAVQGVSGILGGIPKLGNVGFGDKVSTSGGLGGLNDCMISGMLIASFQLIADEDLPDRGRPYCKRTQLDSLAGFMMISDPDIDIPCTSTENAQIQNHMRAGFFYE